MFAIKPVQQYIIEMLAHERTMKIRTIFDNLKKNYGLSLSLVQLYKDINELLDKQILVKKKTEIGLNSRRIGKLKSFVQQVEYNNQHQQVVQLPLPEWTSVTFESDSLYNLDPQWNNGLHKVIEDQQTDVYFFNSHPYHILWLPGTEHSLMNYLASQKKLYYSYGNDTFLDQYGASLVQWEWCETVCIDDHPFMKEGYCLIVIGDYIMESLFPSIITNYFGQFFERVYAIEDFNAQAFADVFKIKAKCSITMRHDPDNAERMRKKIHQLFS